MFPAPNAAAGEGKMKITKHDIKTSPKLGKPGAMLGFTTQAVAKSDTAQLRSDVTGKTEKRMVSVVSLEVEEKAA